MVNCNKISHYTLETKIRNQKSMERRVILEILLGIYRLDKKYKQNPSSRRQQGSQGKNKRIQRFSNFDENDTDSINQDTESQCELAISKQVSFNSEYDDDLDIEEYNFDDYQTSVLDSHKNRDNQDQTAALSQDNLQWSSQVIQEDHITNTNTYCSQNSCSFTQQINLSDIDELIAQQALKCDMLSSSRQQSKQQKKKGIFDPQRGPNTTQKNGVNSVISNSFKQNQKQGSLQYGELRANGTCKTASSMALCRQDSRISNISQSSITKLSQQSISNPQTGNIPFKNMIQTPQCIKKLSNSFGVCPDSLLSAFIQFNSGDQLKMHNIGLIKKQALSMYMENPFNLFNSEQMLDSQLLKLISDYIIQAYSYDYSVIRIQQSNILIKMQFLIKQLIEEFEIEREDEELLEQMLHNIINIDKKNQELRVKTIFCCNRIMVGHSEKFLICNNCGKMCNFQKKSIRKDRNEGSQRNTSYHSIRHFDDVFKQLFIQPIEPIDSITKLQLQDFMSRDHKQKVTIEDVRQYLKQLPGGKGSKLNKSDAYIMGLLNGEILKISAIEYQFIKNTFQQFIQVLYKNTDVRKNTPNCVSFIKNIIDLLYKDIDTQRHLQIVRRLHQQKENTTRKMQKTWQFIISQFDIQAIKQDFKNTIKKQIV